MDVPFTYTVPWDDLNTTFDNVTMSLTYDASGVTNTELLSADTYGLCKKRKIGPPLIITKVPDKSTVTLGQPITYTVTLTNPMQNPADTVTVDSATDVTFNSLLTLGTYNSIAGVPPNTLGVGDTVTGTFTHTAAATDPSPLINEVDVMGHIGETTGASPNPGYAFPKPLKKTATVILPLPLVTLTVVGNPSDVDPGGTITYTATITNTSPYDVQLTAAKADTDLTAPAGQDAATALTAWIAANAMGVITTKAPPASFTYQAVAPLGATKTGPFMSTLTLTYHQVVAKPATSPDQMITATATVNVNNANLHMKLDTTPSIIVGYGQVVTYTETVSNPSKTATDTNLVVSNILLSANDPPPSAWIDVTTGNTLPTQPTTLAPGAAIKRTLQHLVTTNDFSPLKFTATAKATYQPSGGGAPIDVQDTKVSTLIISSAQLLLSPTPDKTQVRAGDVVNIPLTVTNLGSISVNSLNVTYSLNDGVTSGVQVPLLPAIPGSDLNNPNALGPLGSSNGATSGTFAVTLPGTLPANYPNPLIVTITASGTTADGKTFTNVTAQVILHVLQTNVQISEVPDVSAVAVGSSVNYAITVTNPGPDPLIVNKVYDAANPTVPLAFLFPGGTTKTTTGTIPVNGSISTSLNVVVNSLTPNPVLHQTTVEGTTNPVSGTGINVKDTSFSTVNVQGTFLNVTYATNTPQVGNNAVVNFNLSITNTGTKPIQLTSVLDTDQNVAIALKDSKGAAIIIGASGGTQIPPGATVTGVNTVTMTQVGTYTYPSNVEIAAIDSNGQTVDVHSQATVAVSGTGLIFSTPPTPDKSVYNAGDPVTITFNLKNTGLDSSSDLTNVTVACVGNPTGCGTFTPIATLTAGTVAAAQTLIYTVQPTDSGKITLTLQATGTNSNKQITAAASVSFNVAVGGVVLTKSASATSAKVGDVITYTVTLNNTNATPITVSGLSDTLLGNILPNLKPSATIAAKATGTVTYMYTVPAGAPATLVNNVSATFTVGASTTPITATASNSLPIVTGGGGGGGSLSVLVVPSVNQAKVNDQVTYTVTITNASAVDVNNVNVSSSLLVTIPSGFTVPANGAKTFVSTAYTIPAGANGTILNTFNVQGIDLNNQTVTASGSASVTVIGAGGLTVTKTASTNIAHIGDNVTYTINIANNGTADLTVSAIKDSLCGDLTVAVAAPSTCVYTPVTVPLVIKVGASAPAIVVTRIILAADPADVNNVVTVSATDTSSAAFSQIASADVQVITSSGTSGLAISASPTPNAAAAGSTITYVVNIVNTGSSTISNLSATSGPGNPITLPPGQTTLAAGAVLSGAFQYTIPTTGIVPNPLTLTLSVSGKDASNNPVTATGVSLPVTILNASGIGATLTADQTKIAIPGATVIHYQLTLINGGTTDLTKLSAVLSSSSNLAAAGLTATPFSALPGTLAKGSSTSLNFTYTIQSADASKAALNAAVDINSNGVLVATVTNSVQVSNASVSIALTSNCAAPCIKRPGDVITLTATVKNTGSTALNSLVVALSGTNSASATVFAPLPTTPLVGAASVVLTGTYTVPQYNSGDPVNVNLSANVSATPTTGPAVTSNSNTVSYSVTAPVVGITPGAYNPTYAVVGSAVTLNFTIFNNSLTPNTPLYFSPGSSIQISINGGSPTTLTTTTSYPATTPLVQGGAGATLTAFTYTILATDPNPIKYTVSAALCPSPVGCTTTTGIMTVAATSSGSVATNGTAGTVTVTPGGSTSTSSTSASSTGQTGLKVDQSATTTNVLSGSHVTLTIIVTNTSTTTMNNVMLTDTLPTGLLVGTVNVSAGGTSSSAAPTATSPGITTTPDMPTVTPVSELPLINKVSYIVPHKVIVPRAVSASSGSAATTDTGTVSVTNNTLTASLGTMVANQKATITFYVTVGIVTPSTAIVNSACGSVNGASNCTPLTLNVGVGSASGSSGSAGGASLLPVTGMGGPEPRAATTAA